MKKFSQSKMTLSLFLILALVIQLAGPILTSSAYANDENAEELVEEVDVELDDVVDEEDISSSEAEEKEQPEETEEPGEGGEVEDKEDVNQDRIDDPEEEGIDKVKNSTFSNGPKDLGKEIFTDVNIKVDDKNLEPGTTEIEIKDGLQLQFTFDWTLGNDVDLKAGDWAKIRIPSALKGITGQMNGDLMDGETKVGTYEITTDGYLKVEFNDELIEKSDRSGKVGVLLEFNLEEFEEDAYQSIKFENPIDKEFIIKARPGGDVHDIKKFGKPDSKINPEYIDWVIDVNTKLENLDNAVVEDIIPEGLELDFDSIEVYELTVGYKGDITVEGKIENPDKGQIDSGFKVTLGETNKAYQIKYRTHIENFNTEFANDAVLKDNNEKKAKDKFKVEGLQEGTLIEKKGWIDNKNKDQIIWEIDVNKAEQDLNNVAVKDSLPEGLEIKDIKVWELKKSGSGWGTTGDVKVYNEFPVELGNINGAYRIWVTTDINYSHFQKYEKELEFKNEAKLKVDGKIEYEDDAEVKVERESLLEKSGKESTSYGDSKISWTINVNKAKHKIENAKIKDTIGDGLELLEDTIKVFDVKNNKELEIDDELLEITANGFTIDLGTIDSEYRIEYDTKITKNLTEGQKGYTNQVKLEGEGLEGDGVEDGGITKKPTVKPGVSNKYEKATESKKTIDGIEYDGLNYAKKTMSWKLTVDAIKEEITELKIKDSFEPAKSMKFIKDSLRVVKISKGDEGKDIEKVISSDHYDLVDNSVEGFELEFKEDHKPLKRAKYEIYFKTSFDPNDVLPGGELNDGKQYTNHVKYTGKTKDVEGEVKELAKEDDANYSVNDVYLDGGKKSGKLYRENRTIHWEIYANASGRDLTGGQFVITDTLTEGQTFNNDIKVYEFSFSKDGKELKKGDEIKEGFEIVPKDNDGFTLTFQNGIEVPILVEFSSKINGISKQWYENEAKVTDETKIEKTYNGKVEYEKHNDFIKKEATNVDRNTVYTDDEIEWEISLNESLSDIKNAVFEDTISEGQVLIKDSIKVYEDSINEDNIVSMEEKDITIAPSDNGDTELSISLGDIKEKRYFITYRTVVIATDGEISNEAVLKGNEEELESSDKKEFKATQSSWGTGSGKDRGRIEITKVDAEAEEIIENNAAQFELYYYLNDDTTEAYIVTGEAQETKSGKVLYGNLPYRTYYLREAGAPKGYETFTEAPEGYKLNDEGDIIIEVSGSEEINLEVENTKIKTDITGKKIWVGGPENKPEIELQLYRRIAEENEENKEEVGSSVTLDIESKLEDSDDWEYTWEDLNKTDIDGNPYIYTVEEVETPSEYNKSEEGLTVTNTRKTYAIGDYTWIDDENEEKDKENNKDGIQNDKKVLSGVAVELYNEKKEKIAETTTNDDGKYIFDELEAGEYYVKFILTEEQAKKYEFTKLTSDESKAEVDSDANPVAGANYGWTKKIELNENNKYLTTDYKDQEFKASEGIDPTWDAGVILRERISISGSKTWDDAENQDGKRPESITIKLLADGTELASREVEAENDWKWTFENLYKTEAGSDEEIVYTIVEEAIEDYSSNVEGYDVTNSHTPGKTSVQVTKAWKDFDNRSGERPESITVKLLADGEDTEKTLTLTADNNWTDTFKELDEYKAGEKIEYTVEEVEVDGYNSKISGDALEGFVVTNTRKTYAIGDYTWIDSNKDGIQDDDEEVLPGVKVELYDEDGKTLLDTTYTNEEGLYIFDELEAGKYKIKFTLTEEQAKKYEFTKQNSGDDTRVDSDADPLTGWTKEIELNEDNDYLTKEYNIQNFKATEGIDPTWDAGVILREKIEIRGSKVWEGGPKDKPEIELQLYRNGEKLGNPVKLKDGETEYTWTDLYKTDEDREEYLYTIDEVNVPENYEKSISEDGLTITNKYVEPKNPGKPGKPSKPEEPGKDLPRTGSKSNLIIYLAGMVLVLLGIVLKKRITN